MDTDWNTIPKALNLATSTPNTVLRTFVAYALLVAATVGVIVACLQQATGLFAHGLFSLGTPRCLFI
jgi:hypothetical protein